MPPEPTPLAPFGNASHKSIRVKVIPDHPDWNYRTGETVRFAVKVMSAHGPLSGVEVRYSIGPEMMPADEKSAVIPETGIVSLDGGTMREPGFLRCTVRFGFGGKIHCGVATAGFSPDEIKPTQVEPPDFDAFWSRAKEELARLPMDTRLTPLPQRSTAKVEVFHLDLQNIGSSPADAPSRFYGILCVPRKAGPCPAIMAPPFMRYARIHGDIGWVERGCITLQVGIHGIPLTLADAPYFSRKKELEHYETIGLESPDHFYFRRAFMGCLRANDFIVSHPRWDQKHLVVMSGCHGGYLAMGTAALDSRVTACRASFPSFCDVTGYLHGRAGGAPRLFADHLTHPACPKQVATTAYYDTVNFARRIKVPGHYGWGYNDDRCPPTSMFAAYNMIRAPKTLAVFPAMSHPKSPQLMLAESNWLWRQIGKK